MLRANSEVSDETAWIFCMYSRLSLRVICQAYVVVFSYQLVHSDYNKRSELKLMLFCSLSRQGQSLYGSIYLLMVTSLSYFAF